MDEQGDIRGGGEARGKEVRNKEKGIGRERWEGGGEGGEGKGVGEQGGSR